MAESFEELADLEPVHSEVITSEIADEVMVRGRFSPSMFFASSPRLEPTSPLEELSLPPHSFDIGTCPLGASEDTVVPSDGNLDAFAILKQQPAAPLAGCTVINLETPSSLAPSLPVSQPLPDLGIPHSPSSDLAGTNPGSPDSGEMYDKSSISSSPKRKRQSNQVPDESLDEEQLAKRLRRRQRNKESAQQSRQRKKMFMDELSHNVHNLASENQTLNSQLQSVMAENEMLKQLLQFHGVAVPNPPPVTGPSRLQMLGRATTALLGVVLVIMAFTNPLGIPENGNITGARSLQSVDDSLFINDYPAAPIELREKVLSEGDVRPPPPSSQQRVSILTNDTTEDEHVDLMYKALQLIPSTAHFEHRHGQLLTWEALQFIKEHGEPQTQYLFCTDAHSIWLDGNFGSTSHASNDDVETEDVEIDKTTARDQMLRPNVTLSDTTNEQHDLTVFKRNRRAKQNNMRILLPAGVMQAHSTLFVEPEGSRLDEASCSADFSITRHAVQIDPASSFVP